MRLTPLLLAATTALMGCEPLVLGFGEGKQDDEPRPKLIPGYAPFEDGPRDRLFPPQLVISTPDPEGAAAGDVTLDFLITDVDSDGWRVEAWRVGRDGIEQPLSLIDPTVAPHIVEGRGEEVPLAEHGSVVWASGVDIPYAALDQRIRLCPVDAEGNAGLCAHYPQDAPLAVAQPDSGAFCEPGDLTPMEWHADLALVPLGSGDCPILATTGPPEPSDFAARFLLVLANPAGVDAGYTISEVDGLAPPPRTELPAAEPDPETTTPAAPMAPCACLPSLSAGDIDVHTRSFRLRTGPGSDAGHEARDGVLRALGSSVAVYVDVETVSDVDLQPVVDLFDGNLTPTLSDLWGGSPDVDGDCRTTVFFSHRVNGVTATTDGPAGPAMKLAFAEPGRDLWPASVEPGSSEGDVIYAAVPDPEALWSGVPVPPDDYSALDLPPALARAYGRLIGHAAHTDLACDLGDPTIAGPAPQDDWLLRGLAALGADLAGLGHGSHVDAWAFLDATHLHPLEAPADLADAEVDGGPYLFARYLWEQRGDTIFRDLPGSTLRGMAAVDALMEGAPGAFRLQWAAALGTSGLSTRTGRPLVDEELVPPFGDDFPLHGLHTTDGERPVATRGPDPAVFHAQAPFSGRIAAGGFAVVEASGFGGPTAFLVIQSTGPALQGAVVRLADESPSDLLTSVEQVGWAVDTALEDLGLVAAATPRRVVANLDPPTTVGSSTPGSDDIPVADVDRFLFSLDAAATVGVQLHRRYLDRGLAFTLDDPFVAVVPRGDLPDAHDPDMWGFGPATGPCGDPALIAYPNVMPDWLAAQAILLPDPVAVEAPFTASGAVPGSDESLGCGVDQDADGVPDTAEEAPANLIEQVALRQAQNLATDPDHYLGTFDTLADPRDVTAPFFDAGFVDIDSNEAPDDDRAARVLALGIGGRSTNAAEDAVWIGELPAGEYVVVVGDADGGVGPYDLEVRILDP